jgi:hypothetical protein
VENVQYPAEWLAKGGPPFEGMGLRHLPAPLTDYAALTLGRDGCVWKLVVGEGNTVIGEADFDSIVQYLYTYAWHVEGDERKAGAS